ncbi:MAG: hypothetical protein Q7R73_00020 [bacterium]|nr:hypothetical protein [bacterium]
MTKAKSRASIAKMFGMIDEPNRTRCRKLYKENEELFRNAYGSVHNHQSWPGGYHDHIQEIMNIAILFYGPMIGARFLPFSLSDALLVLFLHDLEKPWKYERGEDGMLRHKPEFATKEDAHRFRMQKIAEYGIVLSPVQENALTYVEGESRDYMNRRRIMNELAMFCHMCDGTSARIWYGYPLKQNDPWSSEEEK